eukprot:CAMPEP_0178408338 /NCGR_PEP_ID=MMETSP0689_2-20121128/19888_1 /TAXON_ID=160604 /ORGANISM="Amphidinium massartii, Strain CS-259" /LENGTH=475 /DNA_ID=CAMNT_0020029431 /DNA_START=51 /DNA_END=1479 /DNA_ORIENTATION=-
MSRAAQRHGVAAASSAVQPPPGLKLPSSGQRKARGLQTTTTTDSLSDAEVERLLSRHSLPEAVERSMALQDIAQSCLRSCIESLYRDRILPTLGEVMARLGSVESVAVKNLPTVALPLCIRHRGTYKLTVYTDGKPAVILLKKEPEWFAGWVDINGPDEYSASVWAELGQVCCEPVSSSIKEAAGLLQKRAGGRMKEVSLGELRHLISLALGKALLYFDPEHGGRLLPKVDLMKGLCLKVKDLKGPSEALRRTPTPARGLVRKPAATPAPTQPTLPKIPEAVAEADPDSSDSEKLPEVVAARVSWRHAEMVNSTSERQKMALLKCVVSLYQDQIRPTLGEVQSKLRVDYGWCAEDLKLVLPLALAMPMIFKVTSPGTNKEINILLLLVPSWFRGWADSGDYEFSSDVWGQLERYLQQQKNSTFRGDITKVADELTKLQQEPFNSLSLGETREMLRQAVARQLLVFAGQGLQTGSS